ncbi:MAG TPA: response regulator [Aquihabitans sp.]|jgi:CheY-like chemotaxis protein|nr:response regulator [Aquihabitans sp.]
MPLAAPAPPPSQATVLVVEDDEHLRDLVVQLLGRFGYAARQVGSAEEALEALDESADVALVLTDLVMPGMSGLDLTQVLADRHPHLPVLLTTAHWNPDLQRLLDRTGTDLIRKPYTAPDLRAAVDAACRATSAPDPQGLR